MLLLDGLRACATVRVVSIKFEEWNRWSQVEVVVALAVMEEANLVGTGIRIGRSREGISTKRSYELANLQSEILKVNSGSESDANS